MSSVEIFRPELERIKKACEHHVESNASPPLSAVDVEKINQICSTTVAKHKQAPSGCKIRTGVIVARSAEHKGTNNHFLSIQKSELVFITSLMKVCDVPIMLEHRFGHRTPCGWVIDAHVDPATGRTTIEFFLLPSKNKDRGEPCMYAEDLLDCNTMTDLSLFHVRFRDCMPLPIEVSLCKNGRRNNTPVILDSVRVQASAQAATGISNTNDLQYGFTTIRTAQKKPAQEQLLYVPKIRL